MKGDGGKEEASGGECGGGGRNWETEVRGVHLPGQGGCEAELVRLAYSHPWAASFERGSPGAKDGAAGVSSIRRLAPAISSDFFPDPHGPAGLGEVRGVGQAQGGRRLALPLSGSAAPALRFDAPISSL